MVDVNVQKPADNVRIIRVDGEFFLENLSVVDEAWNEMLKDKPEIVGFDCEKITVLDSSGIGLLVKMRSRASLENFELVFIELSENVDMVFETTKLKNFFVTMKRDEFTRHYLAG